MSSIAQLPNQSRFILVQSCANYNNLPLPGLVKPFTSVVKVTSRNRLSQSDPLLSRVTPLVEYMFQLRLQVKYSDKK